MYEDEWQNNNSLCQFYPITYGILATWKPNDVCNYNGNETLNTNQLRNLQLQRFDLILKVHYKELLEHITKGVNIYIITNGNPNSITKHLLCQDPYNAIVIQIMLDNLSQAASKTTYMKKTTKKTAT